MTVVKLPPNHNVQGETTVYNGIGSYLAVDGAGKVYVVAGSTLVEIDQSTAALSFAPTR